MSEGIGYWIGLYFALFGLLFAYHHIRHEGPEQERMKAKGIGTGSLSLAYAWLGAGAAIMSVTFELMGLP